jgi:hypothetical protein
MSEVSKQDNQLNGAQLSDQKKVTRSEAYNIFSDVVTGVNIRWQDNVYQAVTIIAYSGPVNLGSK